MCRIDGCVTHEQRVMIRLLCKRPPDDLIAGVDAPLKIIRLRIRRAARDNAFTHIILQSCVDVVACARCEVQALAFAIHGVEFLCREFAQCITVNHGSVHGANLRFRPNDPRHRNFFGTFAVFVTPLGTITTAWRTING